MILLFILLQFSFPPLPIIILSLFFNIFFVLILLLLCFLLLSLCPSFPLSHLHPAADFLHITLSLLTYFFYLHLSTKIAYFFNVVGTCIWMTAPASLHHGSFYILLSSLFFSFSIFSFSPSSFHLSLHPIPSFSFSSTYPFSSLIHPASIYFLSLASQYTLFFFLSFI